MTWRHPLYNGQGHQQPVTCVVDAVVRTLRQRWRHSSVHFEEYAGSQWASPANKQSSSLYLAMQFTKLFLLAFLSVVVTAIPAPGDENFDHQPQPYKPEPQPYKPAPQPYKPEPQPHQPEPQPYKPEPQPYKPEPQPYQPHKPY